MGMLGSQEILLIFVAIILLFGASRLPDLARSMGRSMGEFRRGQQDVERELRATERELRATEHELHATEHELRATDREVHAARDGGTAVAGTDIALTRVQRMAMNLGIDTPGKTEEQLLAEIEKKIGK